MSGAYFGERGDGPVQMLGSVRGTDLHSDARLAHWHYRIAEADYVDALFKQIRGHIAGQLGIAQHDRHYGVLTLADRQASPSDGLAEVDGVRLEPITKFGAFTEQIDDLQGTTD